MREIKVDRNSLMLLCMNPSAKSLADLKGREEMGREITTRKNVVGKVQHLSCAARNAAKIPGVRKMYVLVRVFFFF